MLPIPDKCPLCGGEILITRMQCRACDTSLEGRFTPPPHPFDDLTEEQLHFLEVFIRHEGKLKHMESEMNLSYPTLRNRLHQIIRAMGYEPGQSEAEDDETETPRPLNETERLAILAQLESGEITYQEAMQRLTGGLR